MANTFHAAGVVTWQPIVVGTDFKRFGVQVVTTSPVRVYIGQDAPAESTQDYVLLSSDRTRELVLDLESGDTVYLKAAAVSDVAVRGWTEART